MEASENKLKALGIIIIIFGVIGIVLLPFFLSVSYGTLFLNMIEDYHLSLLAPFCSFSNLAISLVIGSSFIKRNKLGWSVAIIYYPIWVFLYAVGFIASIKVGNSLTEFFLVVIPFLIYIVFPVWVIFFCLRTDVKQLFD